MPPQYHRRGVLPLPHRSRKTQAGSEPTIGITRRFSRRASLTDPFRDPRLVFRVGEVSRVVTDGRFDRPPPCTCRALKGAVSYCCIGGEKNINRAKSTPRVGSQTSTKGSIWKDLFLFYIYFFLF